MITYTRAALLLVISIFMITADSEETFSQSLTRTGSEGINQNIPDNPKLNFRLKAAIGAYKINAAAAMKSYESTMAGRSESFVRADEAGNIEVYIYCSDTAQNNIDELLGLGLEVESINIEYGIVVGWMPYDNIEKAADLSFVTKITPPDYGYTRVGDVTTEGDAIIMADDARDFFGVDGTGVKIGVISDGINTLGISQLTGDLPGGIEIGSSGSGNEGTALLEIVHDVAPGAQLAFHTGSNSVAFLDAIDFFRSIGADVIVDDIGFLNQPFFQDGPVAQAAQAAVEDGIVFVSAAGNDGDRHYQADYVDTDPGNQGEFGDDFHDFGLAAGESSDFRLRVAVPPGGSSVVFLQWSDPFGESSNDYDLYLIDSTTDEILNFLDLGEGIGVQDGDDDPVEAVGPVSNIGNVTGFYDIVIDRFSGDPRTLEILLNFNGDFTEFNVPEDSIYGHPAAPGVIAVGATNESDGIRIYSSEGPSSILAADPFASPSEFTGTRNLVALTERPKPDVMAPDGVSTTAPGFTDFFGTSAAAPHVAGVAALIIEGLSFGSQIASLNAADNSVATRVVEEVDNILKSTAQDIGPFGFDTLSGFGRIDAFLAVQAAVGNGGGDPGDPPQPPPSGNNNGDGDGGGGCSVYGAGTNGSYTGGISNAIIMVFPAIVFGFIYLRRRK